VVSQWDGATAFAMAMSRVGNEIELGWNLYTYG
jgi:hypothetical protein